MDWNTSTYALFVQYVLYKRKIKKCICEWVYVHIDPQAGVHCIHSMCSNVSVCEHTYTLILIHVYIIVTACVQMCVHHVCRLCQCLQAQEYLKGKTKSVLLIRGTYCTYYQDRFMYVCIGGNRMRSTGIYLLSRSMY